MTRRATRAAGWLAALAVVAAAGPAARAQLVPGNFTFQFDTTAGVPITGPVTIPAVGSFFSFRVYLLQTGGTPTIDQLGVAGDGVRLNYPGGIVKVPSVAQTNLNPNPAYDFSSTGGTGTGTDTTSSAFITTGIANATRPLPFPSDTGDTMRMLIGTFRIQGVAAGTTTVQARDPFPPNFNNQTGPNPPVLIDAADPSAGFSASGPGAINLDPDLAEFAAVPVIPTLTVTVIGVPEPGTLALGGLAAAGLAVIRRRRKPAPTAPAA